MSIKKYNRGTTIHLTAEIKDVDGNYVDPDTSVKVSLIDPTGATELAETSMTKDSVGHYSYDWQSASNDPLGLYSQVTVSVDGGKTVKKTKDPAFYLAS